MNSGKIYDCAIIGGGLAGLTLAIQLRKKGLEVILFEKETYPFHRVCGEYVAMESWDYLRECGISPEKANLPVIRRLRISAPDGSFLLHDLDPGGFGISRHKLDAELAMQAKNAGVVLLENTRITDLAYEADRFTLWASNDMYQASVVTGAYGKRSNLDKKIGRKFLEEEKRKVNYIGVKYHVKADLPEDLIELHNFQGGYCGIPRIEDGQYCMCYLTTSSNLNASGNDIRKMEEKFLMRNPFLKKYFSEFPVLYDRPLAISQISFSFKGCIENHVLMLGDAAGMITPLCGNGMSMAMQASRMLSRLLPAFVSGELSRAQLEEKYARMWKEKFSTRLKTGLVLQGLSGDAMLTNITLSVLKPFPALTRKLISLTHGESF